jgi:hypothetical protein
MEARIYTLDQAAEFLSICVKTLRKEIAAGNLATFSLGAGKKRPSVRIRHQDLMAMIDQKTSTAKPATRRASAVTAKRWV